MIEKKYAEKVNELVNNIMVPDCSSLPAHDRHMIAGAFKCGGKSPAECTDFIRRLFDLKQDFAKPFSAPYPKRLIWESRQAELKRIAESFSALGRLNQSQLRGFKDFAQCKFYDAVRELYRGKNLKKTGYGLAPHVHETLDTIEDEELRSEIRFLITQSWMMFCDTLIDPDLYAGFAKEVEKEIEPESKTKKRGRKPAVERDSLLDSFIRLWVQYGLDGSDCHKKGSACYKTAVILQRECSHQNTDFTESADFRTQLQAAYLRVVNTSKIS